MAKIMHCPNCGRDVDTEVWTTERIIILIVLLILFTIVGIIYLVYVLTREPCCPVCKMPASQMQVSSVNNYQYPLGPADRSVYCIECGCQNNSSSKYCKNCGKELKH